MDGLVPHAVSPAPAGLGWDPGWAAAFAPFAGADRQPARVVAAHRDSWVLATPHGDRDAVLAGRLRHLAVRPSDLPAVGDWVAAGVDALDTGPAVIHAVLPRRTAFRRTDDEGHLADEQVLAANVDVVLVVTGLDGDFNLRRLERYLAVAWSGGATPVIVLNKADLAADPAGFRVAAEAVAPGVEVRVIAALTGDGVAGLAADHLVPCRRGLAKAAISESLRRLRAAGASTAYLGVDTENHNRAVTLYESCGFRIASTSTTWRRPFGEPTTEARR